MQAGPATYADLDAQGLDVSDDVISLRPEGQLQLHEERVVRLCMQGPVTDEREAHIGLFTQSSISCARPPALPGAVLSAAGGLLPAARQMKDAGDTQGLQCPAQTLCRHTAWLVLSDQLQAARVA